MKYKLYKDGGAGVTELSMKFWHTNKNKIGNISGCSVIEQGLEEDGAEYNMAIHGNKGKIYLSGCNCGYGGTGPNGTAKILEELGVSTEIARKAMYHKSIILIIESECLILDNVGYLI